MKAIILICSLFVVVLSQKLLPEEEAKVFNKYLSEFRIKTGRSDADIVREVFLRNYYDIEEHNKRFRDGLESYEREINKFAHLTDEEFFKTHSGYIPFAINATTVPNTPSRSSRMASPASWSWLDNPKPLVGPVTDQADCATGAVFATIGVIEAHMRIWYGYNIKLSEQEAMQCCGGCIGGTNDYVYDYAKNGGTYIELLPYVAQTMELCNTRRTRVPGSRVESFYRIQSGSAKNGMWFLTNVGPLATSLCFPASFITYKGGVYDDENLSNCVWHGVMVVGFGTENGKDFWLVRNSWGGWGENGYFRIRRGVNRCRIEDDFTFPNINY